MPQFKTIQPLTLLNLVLVAHKRKILETYVLTREAWLFLSILGEKKAASASSLSSEDEYQTHRTNQNRYSSNNQESMGKALAWEIY